MLSHSAPLRVQVGRARFLDLTKVLPAFFLACSKASSLHLHSDVALR